MSDEQMIDGEKLQAILLSLNQQKLIERVAVRDGDLKPARGMERRQRQKRHGLADAALQPPDKTTP